MSERLSDERIEYLGNMGNVLLDEVIDEIAVLKAENAKSDGWEEFEVERQHTASGDWRKDPEYCRIRIRRPLESVKGVVIDGRVVYHDVKGVCIQKGDKIFVYCKADGTAKSGIAMESEINMSGHGTVPGLAVRVHVNPGFETWRMDAFPVEVKKDSDLNGNIIEEMMKTDKGRQTLSDSIIRAQDSGRVG